MPYALYTVKGSTLRHPEVGLLVGGVARPVTRLQADQLRHKSGIILFDSVWIPQHILNRDGDIKASAPITVTKPKNYKWADFRNRCLRSGIKDLKDVGKYWGVYKETKEVPKEWQTQQ